MPSAPAVQGDFSLILVKYSDKIIYNIKPYKAFLRLCIQYLPPPMYIRTLLLTLIAAFIVLVFFWQPSPLSAHEAGPPAGVSGSPKDGSTCEISGCHNAFPLQGSKPGWISSNVPVAGYTPNQTYTITAKAVYIGKNTFGFEISPQAVNGTLLGTLVNTSSKTQIISTKWIGHTINGIKGSDSNVWTFNWKAPVSGTGNVTFYGAFNCGAGNDMADQDSIYTSTLIIHENITGIENLTSACYETNIYPNPSNGKFYLSYSIINAQNIEISLYSIEGKLIRTLLPSTIMQEGLYKDFYDLTGIKSGIYFIRLSSGEENSINKVVID